jgi:hypothetical protein
LQESRQDRMYETMEIIGSPHFTENGISLSAKNRNILSIIPKGFPKNTNIKTRNKAI